MKRTRTAIVLLLLLLLLVVVACGSEKEGEPAKRAPTPAPEPVAAESEAVEAAGEPVIASAEDASQCRQFLLKLGTCRGDVRKALTPDKPSQELSELLVMPSQAKPCDDETLRDRWRKAFSCVDQSGCSGMVECFVPLYRSMSAN